MAVAEESEDYTKYQEYGICWWAGARYTDPDHPLADVSLESLTSMCEGEEVEEAEAFMHDRSNKGFEYLIQVFKKHGCARKEIAAALGIDTRTLNKKLHHPEQLTAGEVNVICETAHCELDDLRETRSVDERAMDTFPTLSDLHRKIVREIIQDFQVSEIKSGFLEGYIRHPPTTEK